jgi:hypothetical protein
MKHHSELLTDEQLKKQPEYQQEANKFLGQKIKSIWVGESLGAVQIETEEGVLRVNGFDYVKGEGAGIFISSTNDERMHHYQRRRTSITGLRL